MKDDIAMPERNKALLDVAEYLPEIMRRLFGGRLIVSEAWELTVPQLRALSIVANRPGCTMGELATSLGIRINAATGVADRLVQHELLEREADPDDRRLVRLRLTESGRRAREACRRERRQRVKEALRHLSAAEQDQIATALLLLHRALDAGEPSARRRGGKVR
jgi:DNA-binding MarR family transcriptional regulator